MRRPPFDDSNLLKRKRKKYIYDKLLVRNINGSFGFEEEPFK
ncbi:hypothetical protein DOT_1131 [Desulfosporosinus sp. OT]|nr:hypothetical protein DOT_1131 [Desulfosporosinus sp. OT]